MAGRLKKLITNPRLTIFDFLNRRGFYRNLSDEKLLLKNYYAYYGTKLDLQNPQTFDEKTQWLKLYDRNPLYTLLADKYLVKKYVSDKIGPEYVIPLIASWDSIEEIDFSSLPEKFALKTNKDSGGLIICHEKSKLDIQNIKERLRNSMGHDYFYISREWPYKDIKPKIFAEELIESDEYHCLFDWKFMCFNGHVHSLFVDQGVIGSNGGHTDDFYSNVYDRDFNLLPVTETQPNSPYVVKKPKNYDKMVEIAELLSIGFPFVRIDLYNIKGKVYFGEYTFYNNSGYNHFVPQSWEMELGKRLDLKLAYKGNN